MVIIILVIIMTIANDVMKSIFLCAKIFWKITSLKKGKLFFIIGILTIKITFTVNFNNLEKNPRGEIGVKLLTQVFEFLGLYYTQLKNNHKLQTIIRNKGLKI